MNNFLIKYFLFIVSNIIFLLPVYSQKDTSIFSCKDFEVRKTKQDSLLNATNLREYSLINSKVKTAYQSARYGCRDTQCLYIMWAANKNDSTICRITYESERAYLEPTDKYIKVDNDFLLLYGDVKKFAVPAKNGKRETMLNLCNKKQVGSTSPPKLWVSAGGVGILFYYKGKLMKSGNGNSFHPGRWWENQW